MKDRNDCEVRSLNTKAEKKQFLSDALDMMINYQKSVDELESRVLEPAEKDFLDGKITIEKYRDILERCARRRKELSI